MFLLVLLCLGSMVLVVVMDQTTMVGLVYLRAVNAGNSEAAQLLGDHFSPDSDWHQRFFEQDIQRDMDYLKGATLSNVTTSREQTLSGQWVTIVRFDWRDPASAGGWQPGALRVKTDKWWFLTYIRAVEVVQP